jgi:hypothetical protein
MSDALRMIRTTSCIALGVVALWTTAARAAFMVTSTCATDVTIVEGNPGSLDCTVTNGLAYPVYIQDVFGWWVTLSKPDKSDKIVQLVAPHLPAGGVQINGKPYNDPMVPAGGTDVLKFLVKTDTADVNELPVDYGINIVAVELYLSTSPSAANPGNFVPSTDSGGVVYVLDAPGLPTTPPVRPPPHVNVGTSGDYNTVKKRVETRGFGTTAPEPSTIVVLIVGLAGLSVLGRRRKSLTSAGVGC